MTNEKLTDNFNICITNLQGMGLLLVPHKAYLSFAGDWIIRKNYKLLYSLILNFYVTCNYEIIIFFSIKIYYTGTFKNRFDNLSLEMKKKNYSIFSSSHMNEFPLLNWGLCVREWWTYARVLFNQRTECFSAKFVEAGIFGISLKNTYSTVYCFWRWNYLSCLYISNFN